MKDPRWPVRDPLEEPGRPKRPKDPRSGKSKKGKLIRRNPLIKDRDQPCRAKTFPKFRPNLRDAIFIDSSSMRGTLWTRPRSKTLGT